MDYREPLNKKGWYAAGVKQMLMGAEAVGLGVLTPSAKEVASKE